MLFLINKKKIGSKKKTILHQEFSSVSPIRLVRTRETREGWPLLTVETEVDKNSKGKQMKGVLSWLVRLVVPQDIFVLPWLL
jgi:hypothetical protein